MKKCKTCGIEKEETEFFRKRKTSLEGSCKKCKRQKVLDKLALNPQKYREKERIRSEQRRKTDEWKEWRKDYQKRKRQDISRKSLEYYHSTPKVKEKQVVWRNKNRDKYRRYLRKYNEYNPLKRRAQRVLNYHVNKGNMTRPDICFECKENCKAEAHHADYTKPLDVIWLCRKCHCAKHRNI